MHKLVLQSAVRPESKPYCELLVKTLVVELWREESAWSNLGEKYYELVYSILNEVQSAFAQDSVMQNWPTSKQSPS